MVGAITDIKITRSDRIRPTGTEFSVDATEVVDGSVVNDAAAGTGMGTGNVCSCTK